MSIRLMAWAKNQRVGDVAAKSVLLFIAERANDAGTCYPSLSTLSDETEIPRRTLQRKIGILVDKGLLSIEERRRVNGDGGRTSNLYRLNAAQDWLRAGDHADDDGPPCQIGAGYVPKPDAPPAPIGGATKEPSPLTVETSDEVSPRKRDVEADFAKWWAVYPRKAERGGALKLFERVLRKGQVSSDALVAAAQRYAIAVHGRDLAMIKNPTTWLQRECWRDFEPATPGPAEPQHGFSRTGFAGPAELRAAAVSYVGYRGEAWAVTWLDPCTWDDAAHQLITGSRIAVERIKDGIGPLLRARGISVAPPKPPPG